MLGELLKNKINLEDFQGIVINTGDGKSEVHWWIPGKTDIYRLSLHIKINGPVSFNRVKGKLKILEV